MGIRIELPPGATPVAAVEAILALYGRENVEVAIEALIERLDAIDGDPDLEPEEDRCAGGDDDLSDWLIERMGVGYDSDRDGEDDESDPSRPLAGARKSREAHRTYLRRWRCTERRGPKWGGGTYRDGWKLLCEPTVPTFRQMRPRRRSRGRGRQS